MMSKFKIKAIIVFQLFMLTVFSGCAQSAEWPKPINLSSALDSTGIIELSGLYYNSTKQTLYAIQDNGGLYLLAYNSANRQFEKRGFATQLGGPEGITQVNESVNEFYTIDEKNYEIRRFSHTGNLCNITLQHRWSLLLEASHMINTDNDGPEGIAFIPDSYLKKVGFLSSETDEKYLSKKGMGGLIFIAHQKRGYIWVYDVNPNKDDDYVFVGKYKTEKNESCDLSFDKSTGLLYILHNTDENSLEVTDLTTKGHIGKMKFSTVAEYTLVTPDGNKNVEGVAVIPKFNNQPNSGFILCRDVSIEDKTEETRNCIWWFNPILLEGSVVKNWNKLSKK